MLSNRVQTLSESLTIAISTMARKMQSEGHDVISLSAGEPDFDTPALAKEAVNEAMKRGCAKYTSIPGDNAVLKAIQTKLKRDNGLEYELSQIITNVGAKHSLFNIFQCIINPDDEVLIPSPYWVSYPEMVKFSQGKPVFIETTDESKFKITAAQLQNAITPKTKALVLNSPSNPSGCIYTKDELTALGKVLEGTNIIVISDEIYEKVNYIGEFCATASLSADMFERTITINGLSKCGAMTGWRFGYLACIKKNILSAIDKLQSQSTSNITSIVQAGAIPVLLGKCDDEIRIMKEAYQARRDWAVDAINKIDGISVVRPDGAFYLFVNCKEVESDSMKFCKKLLEEEKVAVVPGLGFGMDGYFRLSFATDLDSIKKGVKRIEKFIKNYR